MKATIAMALTDEHRNIDTEILDFIEQVERGVLDPTPLLEAFTSLRRHIYMEEEFLFPPVRDAGLVMPILVMLREHATLWQLMESLTELTSDQSADPDGAELLAGCRTLLVELEQHNAKEEPIIYPRADLDLTESALAELATFIDLGSAPTGWTCQGLSEAPDGYRH